MLLAARELIRILVAVSFQTNHLGQAFDPLGDFSLADFSVFQAKSKIFVNGKIWKKCIGLEYDAEIPLIRRKRSDIDTVLDDLPAGWSFETGDASQNSGLAAA